MSQLWISTLVLCFSLIGDAASPTAEISRLEYLIKVKPGHVKARESLGQIYFKQKNYKKVIEILAPYNNEISDTALINLAEAYGKTNDSSNEIRMLKIYEAAQPQRFRPHYLLGLAYKRAGKTDDAIKHFRSSVEFAPKHRPSYEALLEIFNEAKNNYEARTVLAQMAARFGKKPEILSQQCRLFATDGFLKEAVATCKSAVQIAPRTPENHIYLGQAYFDQGNKTAAERIFRTAARQFPKSEFVQYAAGTYYSTEKNFPAAVRYLKVAVALDKKSMRSQLTLAQSLFETKDYKSALPHFDNACRLDETKESWHEFESAGAKLRDLGIPLANDYQLKASVCRPLRP